MKLVKQITGKAGQGIKGGDLAPFGEVSFSAPNGTQTGIIIDGVVYRLAGEPPIAVSHGWGRVPGI